MGILLALTLAFLPARSGADAVFIQVAPFSIGPNWLRSPDRHRAVVLLHGLRPHPFDEGRAGRAELHGWQKPDSKLVKALSKDADVFAFAYSQDVPLDEVVAAPELRQGVARLSSSGYTEIVLVGHSAGGVIARHFVEDNPDAGVTKVVQVCPPNGGSALSRATVAVRAAQGPFLRSLTKDVRQLALRERADKRIPPHVQFVVLVGNGGVVGDGVVSCRCQWTEELQGQGIPAYALGSIHFLAMRTQAGAEKVAEVVRADHPRWTPEQVAAARRKLLLSGKDDSSWWGPLNRLKPGPKPSD
jgi:pimeloyl-ACP methyl ester carboxylesterase